MILAVYLVYFSKFAKISLQFIFRSSSRW